MVYKCVNKRKIKNIIATTMLVCTMNIIIFSVLCIRSIPIHFVDGCCVSVWTHAQCIKEKKKECMERTSIQRPKAQHMHFNLLLSLVVVVDAASIAFTAIAAAAAAAFAFVFYEVTHMFCIDAYKLNSITSSAQWTGNGFDFSITFIIYVQQCFESEKEEKKSDTEESREKKK